MPWGLPAVWWHATRDQKNDGALWRPKSDSSSAVPTAPMGTNEPMFGTDPISYALPTTNGTLCYDAATSVVPRGKLEQLDRTNKQMLPGWALGPDGRCTTDIPRTVSGLKAREGYALLPLGGGDQDYGGHKGAGLALFVELLCGSAGRGQVEPPHLPGRRGRARSFCLLSQHRSTG